MPGQATAVVVVSPCFQRGDANSDAYFDVSDPITILLWLFAPAGEASYARRRRPISSSASP